MRILCLLLMLAGLAFPILGCAQDYCPVNLDQDSLSILKSAPSLYYGKILACEGQILRLEKGFKDQPYFQLKFKTSESSIWVSGQVESGFEKIGAWVKVLGFFEKAAAGYKPEKVHKDDFHLVGVAIFDIASRQMYMQYGQEGIVQQWLNGQIPVAVKKRGEKD